MTKSVTLLLAGTWVLLAGLGGGCAPYSPHGSTEVGLVYDYIIRRDNLHSVVVPAGFHRFSEETDFSTFAGRRERIDRSLGAAMRLTVRAECLATPNASAEWQTLRAQVNRPKTAANAILLAFSARCDGRDGRHYYYVERAYVDDGKRTRDAEGSLYVVYQGRIEREVLLWIT